MYALPMLTTPVVASGLSGVVTTVIGVLAAVCYLIASYLSILTPALLVIFPFGLFFPMAAARIMNGVAGVFVFTVGVVLLAAVSVDGVGVLEVVRNFPDRIYAATALWLVLSAVFYLSDARGFGRQESPS